MRRILPPKPRAISAMLERKIEYRRVGPRTLKLARIALRERFTRFLSAQKFERVRAVRALDRLRFFAGPRAFPRFYEVPAIPIA